MIAAQHEDTLLIPKLKKSSDFYEKVLNTIFNFHFFP